MIKKRHNLYIPILLLTFSPSCLPTDKMVFKNGKILDITEYTYKNGIYHVEVVNIGKKKYNKTEVYCIGEGCKNSVETPINCKEEESPVMIYAENIVRKNLIPKLIEPYVSHLNLSSERQIGDSDDFIFTIKKWSDICFKIFLKKNIENISPKKSYKDKNIFYIKVSTLSKEVLGLHKNEHLLALGAIPIIVNKKNHLKQLSLQQIINIFSGEITNWKDVKGVGGKINIYALNEKSELHNIFNSLIFPLTKTKLRKEIEYFESSIEVSNAVAKDSRGIGFTSFNHIRNTKTLSLRNDLCEIPFELTPFSVKTGEYPLSYQIIINTNTRPLSRSKDFIKYMISDKSQTIINDNGFINKSIILGKNEQKKRLDIYIGEKVENTKLLKTLANKIDNADRLSILFQFQKNSSVLSNKAQQDIKRLAGYLRQNRNLDKKIMLLGFSDSEGNFKDNEYLSQQRADSIARALAKEGVGVEPNDIKGYSELTPLFCDRGDNSGKNRRVEVWVKKDTKIQ